MRQLFDKGPHTAVCGWSGPFLLPRRNPHEICRCALQVWQSQCAREITCSSCRPRKIKQHVTVCVCGALYVQSGLPVHRASVHHHHQQQQQQYHSVYDHPESILGNSPNKSAHKCQWTLGIWACMRSVREIASALSVGYYSFCCTQQCARSSFLCLSMQNTNTIIIHGLLCLGFVGWSLFLLLNRFATALWTMTVTSRKYYQNCSLLMYMDMIMCSNIYNVLLLGIEVRPDFLAI